VVVVAVSRLHEDGSVGEALGEHFATHVVKMNALADMSARVFDGRVSVDVGQEAETESVVVVGRIGEAVDDDGSGLGVEDFADSRVELVISDGSPISRFLVRHGIHVLRNIHRRWSGSGIVVVDLIRRRRRIGREAVGRPRRRGIGTRGRMGAAGRRRWIAHAAAAAAEAVRI